MQQQQMFSIREIDSCGNSGFAAFFALLAAKLFALAAVFLPFAAQLIL